MNEHAITYCRDFLHDGVQIECACGWKTEWVDTDAQAEMAWSIHVGPRPEVKR